MRLLAGLVLLPGLIADPALAVPSYTEKLFVNMKAAMEPEQTSVRKLTFIVSGTQGEPARWVAYQVRKSLSDGKRTLTVFLEPESVKGIALLTWERKDQPTLDFVYLAPSRRLVKNPDLEALQLLYSEFTFADIGVITPGDTQVTLLGSDQHAGKRTMKVQEVPRAPRSYARTVTWFVVESSLPVEREFYDATDEVVKTERFDFEVIDGASVATRTRIDNKVDGGKSEMLVSDVRSDIDIPDTLFDSARLGQVAEDPFWKTFTVSPTPVPPPPPPRAAVPAAAVPVATPPAAAAPPAAPPPEAAPAAAAPAAPPPQEAAPAAAAPAAAPPAAAAGATPPTAAPPGAAPPAAAPPAAPPSAAAPPAATPPAAAPPPEAAPATAPAAAPPAATN